MNLKQYKKDIDKDIIEPLIDIRNEDDDCGFCTRQVMVLRKNLFKYAKAMSKVKVPNEVAIEAKMKKLVFAINKLNRQADYCMLESEVGDEIIYIIESIAFEAGYPKTDKDITKSWREEW